MKISRMKDIELENLIVDFVEKQSVRKSSNGAKLAYTPTQIVSEVGGNAQRVGVVMPQVVKRLRAGGFQCDYEKRGNNRTLFILQTESF